MTRKMMGVIYRAYKEGKLANVTEADINKAYYFVKKLETPAGWELKNYYRSAYNATMSLKGAVEAIFAGDYEAANAIVAGFSSVPVC